MPFLIFLWDHLRSTSGIICDSGTFCGSIGNFRYLKIQSKTIDLSARLWGITRVCGAFSPEPRVEVYRLRLNFNISKLVYWGSFPVWGSFAGCTQSPLFVRISVETASQRYPSSNDLHGMIPSKFKSSKAIKARFFSLVPDLVSLLSDS